MGGFTVLSSNLTLTLTSFVICSLETGGLQTCDRISLELLFTVSSSRITSVCELLHFFKALLWPFILLEKVDVDAFWLIPYEWVLCVFDLGQLLSTAIVLHPDILTSYFTIFRGFSISDSTSHIFPVIILSFAFHLEVSLIHISVLQRLRHFQNHFH